MSSRSRTWLAIYARALRNTVLPGPAGAQPPRRILLPHHSLLGDTILLTACAAKLRALYPAAEIVHVMPRAFTPLFASRPFGVDAVGWSVRDPASLQALWRLGSFDLALINGDSRFSWLARAIGARRIAAFAGDRPAYKSWPVTDSLPMPDEPMSWSDLVTTLVPGPPPPPYARGHWQAPPFRPYERPAGCYAVLHVGASTMHKTWPAAQWAGVAAALEARAITPCWSAGPGEEALVAAIPGSSRQRNFAGLLDLPQLWDFLANASLVVTGDTSVAHISRAAFAPTVVLYGPSGRVLGGPGRFWANCPGASVSIDPFPCRDQDLLFKRHVTWVRRCTRGVSECPVPRCMQEISVQSVLAAVDETLAQCAP
ncbi:MAG: glycosyltransferase family 9 protein [Betaproteobacteria bacterium]|nr:glycosyltransferase family 9 protein [Betaproteobacteria bacterium]